MDFADYPMEASSQIPGDKMTINKTNAELPAVRVLPNKPKALDLWNQFFHEKHGAPLGWKMGKINCSPDEVPDGFAKVTGGLRIVGKDGRPKRPPKTKDNSFFIKMADLREYEAQAAIAAGACPACWGEGRIQTTISVHPEQNRYRSCERCNGTGLPPESK